MKKIFYRVEKFDDLTNIEQKFGIPKSVIIYDNNLKREVREGDLIVLNIGNDKLYTVMPTEKLEDICKKFNMEEGDILYKNKIENVYPFQKIWVK